MNLHFLDMAYGHARESEYQTSLAYQLGFQHGEKADDLKHQTTETCKVPNGLLKALRKH